MKFTLEIACDNDAFADTSDMSRDREVSRVLACAARRVASQGLLTTNTALFDANGNRVGQWTYGEKKC